MTVRLTTSPPIQTPTRSERTRTFMIGKVGSVKGEGYAFSDRRLIMHIFLRGLDGPSHFLDFILLKKSSVLKYSNIFNFKSWNIAIFYSLNDSLWLSKSYLNGLYMIRVQNSPLK